MDENLPILLFSADSGIELSKVIVNGLDGNLKLG